MEATVNETIERLKEDLGEIELRVLTEYTLADAIREGASVSKQAQGFGNGHDLCAMSSAYVAAKARGYI